MYLISDQSKIVKNSRLKIQVINYDKHVLLYKALEKF